MKKIASLLLCLCLVFSLPTVAFAQTAESSGDAVISASVPETHKITVYADGADVMFNGEMQDSFTVERLSEPTVIIRAESGKSVKQVLLNGEDITSQIKGGYYTLEPVYEDKTLTVITEDDEVVPQSKTYTVKGTVKRNGEPIENVTLELRSTLKTDVTDSKGRFSFADVECGKHSLTAIENGKIVGYVEFELTEGMEADFSLQESGLYKVTANQDEIGVDLTLNLNDDDTMQIDSVTGVKKSILPSNDGNNTNKDNSKKSPNTGAYDETLIFSTALLAIGIVAFIAVIFKKKKEQFE
ncbi:MAG: carboxypeptidase-like regulatory domain-containing protein [Ruminococcus sp.]